MSVPPPGGVRVRVAQIPRPPSRTSACLLTRGADETSRIQDCRGVGWRARGSTVSVNSSPFGSARQPALRDGYRYLCRASRLGRSIRRRRLRWPRRALAPVLFEQSRLREPLFGRSNAAHGPSTDTAKREIVQLPAASRILVWHGSV